MVKRGAKKKAKDVVVWYRSRRELYTREDIQYHVQLTKNEADAVYYFLLSAEKSPRTQRWLLGTDSYGDTLWEESSPCVVLDGLEGAVRAAKNDSPKPRRR